MANFDYFSIGTDSDAAFGKSTASKILLPIPENKREMPCDGCSNESICAAKGLECSAFRTWSAKGDFKNSDIQRHLRTMK